MNQFYPAFARNSDGSWTCVAPATLNHPAGRVQVAEGTRVYPGTTFMGVDLVGLLEEERRRRNPEPLQPAGARACQSVLR